jgi:hypothetical protein
MLLLGATLLAAGAASGRTSCPVTTTVPPYEVSTSARYEIVLTDGGSGDLDGIVDCSC